MTITATRASDAEVQIDLPRARGMRFSVEDATKLRDQLTTAINQHLSSVRVMAIEAIIQGRRDGARPGSFLFGSGKIQAIKKLRDMTNMSLFDAKTLIEEIWNSVPVETT